MNPWTYAFAGLALFAAGYLTKGVAEARRSAEVSTALQAQLLDYNAKSINATRAEAERIIAAVAERNPQREQQAQLVHEIIKEVQNAPSTETCVSSPAIRLALERLRALEAAGPDRNQP